MGKVIGARGKSLFVDLGGKSEGVIPLDQFEGEIPAPGSEIEVIVDHFDPSEGIQHLRLKGAAVEATWENLRKGSIVEARVTKINKGGVEVDVDGIRGFMPISQIDLVPRRGRRELRQPEVQGPGHRGQRPREEPGRLAPRAARAGAGRACARRPGPSLEEGQVREGMVRSVKDFGAFVDLGGVDGLLPIGEMSWSRVQKVEDLVKTGDKVQVKVLKIDPVARKLTLGLKQLTPSPWETVEDKYPRGLMVKGKVTKLMDFGAFVELEPGIEGLIHISELSPDPRPPRRRHRPARPGGRGPHPQGRARGQADRPLAPARQGQGSARSRRTRRRGPTRPRPPRSPNARSRSRGGWAISDKKLF